MCGCRWGGSEWWWQIRCMHCVVEFINGLMQERRYSSALAMELRLSCTNPSIWSSFHMEMHVPRGRVCKYFYYVFSDDILSLNIVNHIFRSDFSYHSIILSLNIVNHISRSNYSYPSILLSLNIVNHISRSNYSYLLWRIIHYHGILVRMKHLYWNAPSVMVT